MRERVEEFGGFAWRWPEGHPNPNPLQRPNGTFKKSLFIQIHYPLSLHVITAPEGRTAGLQQRTFRELSEACRRVAAFWRLKLVEVRISVLVFHNNMRIIFWFLTVCWLKSTLATTIFDKLLPQTFIFSRCKNSTDTPFMDEIKNRLKIVNDYFDNLQKPTFCSEDINKLIPIMKQITADIQRCFTRNETYLPKFMYEGFADFMEFLCGNRTIEIFFSDQGEDCKEALIDYDDGEKIANCSCRYFRIFDNELLTYDLLCFELNSVEKCFDEAMVYGCPHFAAFRMLNSQFFRAIGALCNRAAGYFSSEVLIISVFLIPRFVAININ
ncbi:hypothetical protein Zmor_025884 [Zophobas morio]|uniref:Uncharacterized protein n=1 Tax=Zophobas morio TaxID=2755281 RepID=A0AA38HSB5_9CUCU|nr:hypothetical protein Zmor_025884 [Zophobas morio]